MIYPREALRINYPMYNQKRHLCRCIYIREMIWVYEPLSTRIIQCIPFLDDTYNDDLKKSNKIK
jgi:hypothetical protein